MTTQHDRRERGLPAYLRWCIAYVGAVCILVGVSGQAQQRFAADQHEAQALGDQALRLLERGELGEAILVAKQGTTIAPYDPRAWLLLAELRAIADRPREAAVSHLPPRE